MCRINSTEAQHSALMCLTGVVSAHLAKRFFEHEIEDVKKFTYIHLSAQSLTGIDLERIIKLVGGFNASMRIESVIGHLSICLYF